MHNPHCKTSRSYTLRQSWLILATVALFSATNARAFNAVLQGQSFGNTNWTTGHIYGWAELDLIPTRVALSGGPATNKTITVQFPHDGVQNLYSFAPSANVVITSGPTLSAPANSSTWVYSLTIDLTDNNPGSVEFRVRLSAGAHRYTGSSLQVASNPGGKLLIFKPAVKPGSPDLSIVKLGPVLANPGATIAYSISYSNAVNGSTATGVQITDTLPSVVSLVDCSGGCEPLGNTITWDLGDLPRGATGIVTYRVAITNIITTGFHFHNDAAIASAEDEPNLTNNQSSITTIVTSNCVPSSLVAGPTDAVACVGEPVTFSVHANGTTLSYQWRKDGVEIAGATDRAYSIVTCAESDAGSYDVVVTAPCGSPVTSPAATLTVAFPPSITQQPSDATVTLGDPVELSVTAAGTGLTYQWRKDDAAIDGATNTTFSIAAATEADTGSYDVIVSGACGSAADSAVVTVTVSPAIDAPTANADTYEVNENDTLTVPAPGVLANDNDPNSLALTAVLASDPAHGAVALNPDGSFTYVPNVNYSGPDSFTYRANNGTAESLAATVNINVLPVNATSDLDLYVKRATAKLDWARHNDSLSLSGQINPRGMNNNLTGATVALQLNGVDVLAPITLDAKGRGVTVSGSTRITCRLKNTNGAYKLRLRGTDLRTALGLANTSQTGLTVMTVRLTINGAFLDVPVMSAQLETPYRTTANKATSLKFNFRRNHTLTGAFNCNKTAGKVKVGQLVITRGVLTAGSAGMVTPIGDITVHVGNATTTVPFSGLATSGGVSTFAADKGASGALKFTLNNDLHSFALAVASDSIGLPPAGSGPTTYDLPVLIEVPTSNGMMYFQSIIELKRASETSGVWKR
jgi:uncharacterized repeat protein (TIGR01451 family)